MHLSGSYQWGRDAGVRLTLKSQSAHCHHSIDRRKGTKELSTDGPLGADGPADKQYGARSGAVQIIIATAIAGVAGYLVTFIVFRAVGAAEYATFAVYWATLYLAVGSLSGVQQEITRATRRRAPGSSTVRNRALRFAVVVAVGTFVLILSTSPLWSPAAFPSQSSSLAVPLAVGASSYVLVATLSGSLYGLSQWRSLAMLVATDALLRLALVGIVLIFTRNLALLAWMVAIPFPLTIVVLWRSIRGGLVGQSELDVRYGALTWNVARTVIASASTSILVSGFPLILGVAGRNEPAPFLGQFIFALTLTRAPLIVTVMSLQSFFIVRFRDAPEIMWKTFARACLIVLGGGLALAIAGLFLGPWALAVVSGERALIAGPVLAVLVASSALVAWLSISGSAVLSRGGHFVYSAGWVGAAVATILAILLPLPFLERAEIAMVVGPSFGLVIHLTWLAVSRHGSKTALRTTG